jgi:hypothetical protein
MAVKPFATVEKPGPRRPLAPKLVSFIWKNCAEGRTFPYYTQLLQSPHLPIFIYLEMAVPLMQLSPSFADAI